MDNSVVETEFYINPVRKDEELLPQLRVSTQFYNSHFEHEINSLPIVVAKLTHNKHSCYVQIREADSLYIDYFKGKITFWGELQLFEEPSISRIIPIMFISENYRRKLFINDISLDVDSQDKLKQNIKEIAIEKPKSLYGYFFFLMMACYGHSELYSFFMFIIGLFGLLFTISSLIHVLSQNVLVGMLGSIGLLWIACKPIVLDKPLKTFKYFLILLVLMLIFNDLRELSVYLFNKFLTIYHYAQNVFCINI